MATKTATRKPATGGGSKVEIDWRAMLIEAMDAPGNLGDTYCRFYDYSFLNQLRLMMQGVREPVATYRRWSELGYQVQKGTHAKCVLAPIMVNREMTNDGVPVMGSDGKPVKRQVLIGFRDSRTVFGFSDTDGEQLPEITYPSWDLDEALKSLDVQRVRFSETDGNIQGYSLESAKGRKLAINPAAKYPHKVVFHELAHLVLGHCKDAADGKYASDIRHRGICEFQAEATAYLVSKELELTTWDDSESRAYIQHWLDRATDGPTLNEETGEGEYELSDKVISQVFSAVNKILTAGRKRDAKAA